MTLAFSFDQDINTVVEKLFDPDFRVDRSVALGDLSADCEIDGSEHAPTVLMNREVLRDLPSVLAKVFNPKQTLRFTENWQREGDDWVASVKVEVQGQPVVISADYRISPKGDGCEYTATHKCKAKIPLVGGKVEKFVLAQTDDGAEQELRYLAEALA